MIKVTGLSRKYGDYTAVDDVTFSIGKGEVIGLLGHNGAGKTTIMKMLTGYLEPNAGSIEIDGLEMTDNRRQIQSKIGYLPENCPVYPEMTVIDYLDYAAELHGLTDEYKIKAVADAIASTELTEKAGQKIQTLSRGYRQRVGVAQALLHQPEILILDEPTNGLDPTQILHMRELVKSLSQTATVIVSTHILQEVAAMCERVLIMRQGKLVTDAKLNELQHSQSIQLSCSANPEKIQSLLTCQHGIQAHKQQQEDQVFTYQLTLEESDSSVRSVIPEIVNILSAHDISIYSISPEQHDLESVFRQINAIDKCVIDGGVANAA